MEPITFKFLTSAEDHPDRPSLSFLMKNLYQDLHERAFKVAKALHSMGVNRGDHVGILMANSIDYVAVLFGAAFLGLFRFFITAVSKPERLHMLPATQISK